MDANEIKSMRESLGLSRAQLARKLAVSPSTVAKWERAARKPSRKSQTVLELVFTEEKLKLL